jgi:hypothetical protein
MNKLITTLQQLRRDFYDGNLNEIAFRTRMLDIMSRYVSGLNTMEAVQFANLVIENGKLYIKEK